MDSGLSWPWTASNEPPDHDGSAAVQTELDWAPDTSAQPAPADESATAAPAAAGVDDAGAGLGSARIGTGVFSSRYAGAMLLYGFTHWVGAGDVFASGIGVSAPRGDYRFDDVAILNTARSAQSGLGRATYPALHRDLVPEDQDLRVLSGVTPCQSTSQPNTPDHEQIDETDQHERRA
jgi:hypothetical protein